MLKFVIISAFISKTGVVKDDSRFYIKGFKATFNLSVSGK